MRDFNRINSEEILRKKEEKDRVEKRRKAKKFWLNFLKWFGVFTGTCVIIGALLVSMFLAHYGADITELFVDAKQRVENVTKETFNSRQPTRVYDKDGKVIYEYKENSYIYSSLDELNEHAINAFVAIEDNRFYKHNGMDYIGTTRAALNTLLGSSVQGGSSITQQLSKNVFLSNEKTIERKIIELVIASNLERKFTKEELFEFYANNIYYGYGCYSFESASQYYFQKNNKELTPGQVAILAGVVNNPTLYDPIRNPDNAKHRRNRILTKMYEQKFIKKDVYEAEIAKDLNLNVGSRDLDNTIKDDMVSYAIDSATKIFMEQNGFQFQYSFKSTDERKDYWAYYTEEYKEARKSVLTGGYEIHTVVDQELNKRIQTMAQNYMKGFTSTTKDGVYKKQVSLTAIDNKTGKVIAMVGGRGQNNDQLNRAYQSPRQPGSSIKPLVAYAPAFETGKYIPSSTFEDSEIAGGPRNSNGGYSGTVTLRYALEKSINTIPYRLASQIGGEKALSYLENMQFKTLTHTDKNPIIAVGGFTKGVTTEEMAAGFATLARNGEYLTPNNITKIVKTNTQQVIYEDDGDGETVRVYDEGASYLTTDSLKGVLTSGTGTAFKPSYPYVAGKTGTTNMQKDRWMVGYTPYHTVAVWVGDDTPRAQSGIMQQGYIWRDAINILSEGKKVVDFEKPESVTTHNGNLVSSVYLNGKESSSNSKRLSAEKERIKQENEIHKDRISSQDYRILYGLTKEEELRRESEAERMLSILEGYSLTSKSQFSEIDELLSDAKYKIDLVKHQKAYNKYNSRYSSLKNKFNSIKNTILNPPVIEEPKHEQEDSSNDSNTGNSTPNGQPDQITPPSNNSGNSGLPSGGASNDNNQGNNEQDNINTDNSITQ